MEETEREKIKGEMDTKRVKEITLHVFFGVGKMPERFSGYSRGCSNNAASSTLTGSDTPPGGAVPTMITG